MLGRFESAFDHAPIGMALVDMSGRWLQVNDALCRIVGHAQDELKATTLKAITHPDDVNLAADDLQQLLAGEIRSYQAETRYRHAWGHYVWVLLTVSLVHDAEGRALHLIQQVQDISKRKELARHLEYLVDHDFLTGLHNRRYFERELAREVERARRYGTPAALLVIDLDHFKDINDSLGHKAGDNLLKNVAGGVRCTRPRSPGVTATRCTILSRAASNEEAIRLIAEHARAGRRLVLSVMSDS